jgi:DNA-binding winged helix-turn-helix (wHTH) protein
MSSYIPPASLFRFGVFELDACRGELRKYGLKIRIGKQALKLLLLLLQSPGQMVSRDALSHDLLPRGNFGDVERTLNKAICQLRQVLGDSASSPRYIETLANQGYRFIPLPENSDQHPAHMRRPRRLDSIAVLPLASEAIEPELGFIAGQVVCQLINKVSSTPRVRVLAYNMVKHYNHDQGDPQNQGRKLGVQGVVTGEILRHEQNLIVELELIDVADGAHLWGMQITEPWPEAANKAGHIAEQIACELQPILEHGRRPLQLSSPRTDSFSKTPRDTVSQVPSIMGRKLIA